MEELKKVSKIKVAPVISYIPYHSYQDAPINSGNNSNNSSRNVDVEERKAREEIQNEKIAKSCDAEKRNKIYSDILLNKSIQQVPYRYVCYGWSGVILSIVLTSIVTVIPVHNLLDDRRDMSNYWWENFIQTITGFMSSCCAYMLLNCSYWTNIDFIRTLKNFSIFYILSGLFGIILGGVITMVWIYILNYRFPPPFYGIIWAYISIYFAFVPLWYRFPRHWRKLKDIRRRFKYFILAISVNLLITAIYTFYTKAFLSISKKYQWLVAVFLIPIREFNVWLQTKVGFKTAGVEDSSVSITCGHNINMRHCFFLSVVLGTIATDLTCWVILVIDVGINLYLCLRIVWTKMKIGINENNESQMVDLFLTLIINQTVEIVVPFTYVICFIISYYGPNAEMIGTVKSEYGHHIPVKEIEHFCQNLGFFLLADCLSVTTTCVLFWIFCRVNIIRAFAYMQKEFWLIMAVNTAYTVNVVSY